MSPTKDARPSPAQPVTRRSARQERIARRHPERDLRRASTKGRGRPSPLMIGTGAAMLIGLVIVAFAFLNTGGAGLPLSSMQPPPFLTDAKIHQSGTSGMTLGDENAKVTMDLWEDYQCTGCGSFTRQDGGNLIKDYVETGKVKLVYHDYLVTDLRMGGTESLDAANAARCAGDQGKYWQYHDWLFANQPGSQEHVGAYAKDRLLDAGRKLGGLDMTKFEACVKDGQHDAEVKAESAKSPVDTTPGIFVATKAVSNKVNPQLIPRYEEDIKAAIEEALANPNPSASPNPSSSASPSASASPTASASTGASASPSRSASASASASAGTSPSPSPSASASS